MKRIAKNWMVSYMFMCFLSSLYLDFGLLLVVFRREIGKALHSLVISLQTYLYTFSSLLRSPSIHKNGDWRDKDEPAEIEFASSFRTVYSYCMHVRAGL